MPFRIGHFNVGFEGGEFFVRYAQDPAPEFPTLQQAGLDRYSGAQPSPYARPTPFVVPLAFYGFERLTTVQGALIQAVQANSHPYVESVYADLVRDWESTPVERQRELAGILAEDVDELIRTQESLHAAPRLERPRLNEALIVFRSMTALLAITSDEAVRSRVGAIYQKLAQSVGRFLNEGSNYSQVHRTLMLNELAYAHLYYLELLPVVLEGEESQRIANVAGQWRRDINLSRRQEGLGLYERSRFANGLEASSPEAPQPATVPAASAPTPADLERDFRVVMEEATEANREARGQAALRLIQAAGRGDRYARYLAASMSHESFSDANQFSSAADRDVFLSALVDRVVFRLVMDLYQFNLPTGEDQVLALWNDQSFRSSLFSGIVCELSGEFRQSDDLREGIGPNFRDSVIRYVSRNATRVSPVDFVARLSRLNSETPLGSLRRPVPATSVNFPTDPEMYERTARVAGLGALRESVRGQRTLVDTFLDTVTRSLAEPGREGSPLHLITGRR